MNSEENYYLALDLGTGLGTKIALFKGIHFQVAEVLLKVDAYGTDFHSYTENLEKTINSFLQRSNIRINP